MDIFDEEENQRRKQQYYKNPSDEQFLASLNEELVELEQTYNSPEPNQGPLVFLFGLPRSGTTLCYQLLGYCLDVGFINNLAARFWQAPLIGIRLSRLLLGDEMKTQFNSNIGQTEFIYEPHEFGYFWSNIFNYDDNRLGDLNRNINWDRIQNKVLNIQNAFKKPTLFKNLIYAFHLNKFSSIFENALFISIERKLVDTALSILETREERYGDKNSWWSVRPPNYEKLSGKPYWIQIPEQMKQLNDRYKQGIERSSDIELLHISYEKICHSPRSILDKVTDAAEDVGFELRGSNSPPDSFNVSKYKNHEDYDKVKDELLKRFPEEKVV